jgi:hypothetical protein
MDDTQRLTRKQLEYNEENGLEMNHGSFHAVYLIFKVQIELGAAPEVIEERKWNLRHQSSCLIALLRRDGNQTLCQLQDTKILTDHIYFSWRLLKKDADGNILTLAKRPLGVARNPICHRMPNIAQESKLSYKEGVDCTDAVRIAMPWCWNRI